ncbi:Cache 3/Cache 2 fusion domain-containing protein [Uliginosibacterium paludis]|uniref:histidine kinase n=1 Tax=Uliginosibacterium paludis TaxID=1615952 RepID=A0ABV2CLN2_9RHOO
MKLQESLRVRLLLPVLALVIVVVVALTAVLASIAANNAHDEAEHSIKQQTSALQSLFAVTRSIMIERVQSSMRLLRQQAAAMGPAGSGGPVELGGRTATNLLFGAREVGGNNTLVDNVTDTMQGTATIFSRTGDDYVRISTNVKKDDGSRAVGTVLDPKGKVIGRIQQGESFYGVVDILGTPYVTGYEPILAGNARPPIGIFYVGYKTDMAELDAVVSSSRVLDSGFIALFDSKGTLRFSSKGEGIVSAEDMAQIVKLHPDDWVVSSEEVPGWGFTLVSAYPKRDVNAVIVRQSLWIAGLGLIVCVVLLSLQSMLIWKRVLSPVQRLTKVAEELSLGRWEHSIAEVDLKDEIGTLARAIARLSNSVRLAMERLAKRS